MRTPTRLCVACQKRKPEKEFLPSKLSPAGYVEKCTSCIRAAAQGARIDRVQRASSAAASASRALTAIPAVRPLQARIEPRLVKAASRYIAERRSGRPTVIDTQMEPELRALLVWLHDLALKETKKPQTPEEIGRDILGYRDNRTSRGVTFGALWASLVRCAAIYAQQDAPKQMPRLVVSKTLGSTPRIFRHAGSRKAVADILKPAMLRAIEPAKGQVLELGKAYSAYQTACRSTDRTPVAAEQFEAALVGFCKAAGITTKRKGSELVLLNVQLKGASQAAQKAG
jgi:hypothetical protein